MDAIPAYDELKPLWKKITAQHGYSRFGGKSFESWLTAYSPVLMSHGIHVDTGHLSTVSPNTKTYKSVGSKATQTMVVVQHYPRDITINARLTPGSDIIVPLSVNAVSPGWSDQVNELLSSHLGIEGRLVNHTDARVELTPDLHDEEISKYVWEFHPHETTATSARYLPHTMQRPMGIFDGTSKGKRVLQGVGVGAKFAATKNTKNMSAQKVQGRLVGPALPPRPLNFYNNKETWITSLKKVFLAKLVDRTATYLATIKTKDEFDEIVEFIYNIIGQIKSALESADPMLLVSSSSSTKIPTINQIQHILEDAAFGAIPRNLISQVTKEPIFGEREKSIIVVGSLRKVEGSYESDEDASTELNSGDIKLPFIDFLQILNREVTDSVARKHMLEIVLVYYTLVKEIFLNDPHFTNWRIEMNNGSGPHNSELDTKKKYLLAKAVLVEELDRAFAETIVSVTVGDTKVEATLSDHLDKVFVRASQYSGSSSGDEYMIGGFIDDAKRKLKGAVNVVKKAAKGVRDGAKNGIKEAKEDNANAEHEEKMAEINAKEAKLAEKRSKVEEKKKNKGIKSKISALPTLVPINSASVSLPALVPIGSNIGALPALVPLNDELETAGNLPALVPIGSGINPPQMTIVDARNPKLPKLIPIDNINTSLPPLIGIGAQFPQKGSSISNMELPKLIPLSDNNISANLPPLLPINSKVNLPPLVSIGAKAPTELSSTHVKLPELLPLKGANNSKQVPTRPPLVDLIGCHLHMEEETDAPPKTSKKDKSKRGKNTATTNAKVQNKAVGAPVTHSQTTKVQVQAKPVPIGCTVINEDVSDDEAEEVVVAPKKPNTGSVLGKRNEMDSADTEQPQAKKPRVTIVNLVDDIESVNTPTDTNNPNKISGSIESVAELASKHKCRIAFDYLHNPSNTISCELKNKIVVLPCWRGFSHAVAAKIGTNATLREHKHKDLIFDVPFNVDNLKQIAEDKNLVNVKGSNYNFTLDDGFFNYNSQHMRGNVTVKLVGGAYYGPTNTLYLMSSQ
jgi:hypothetical protein